MLSDLPAADLVPLVERLVDLALHLSADGKILAISVYSDEFPAQLAADWKGRRLAEVVDAGETSRLEEAMQSARGGEVQRLDLVHSHAELPAGLPLQYQLRAASKKDGFYALGRDMRPTANLRQQLINAQQALEQDYWRLRQVETRYRRLFDMVGDAVLILDGQSRRVLEANPTAGELLGAGERSIVGKVFPRGFDARADSALQDMLKEIRATGRGQLRNLRLADGETRVDAAASFLRQGSEERYLLRLSGQVGAQQQAPGSGAIFLQEALRAAPDGVLLVDADGRIEAVNASFLSLAQILGEEQAVGQLADRWLGRSSVDMNVLLSNLQENAAVRLFGQSIEQIFEPVGDAAADFPAVVAGEAIECEQVAVL